VALQGTHASGVGGCMSQGITHGACVPVHRKASHMELVCLYIARHHITSYRNAFL
jgi:hypothetical protein